MENTDKIYQTEMLRILKHIDKTLTENGIWYCVAYGTMLGTVRENGFIPWDRDIDVFIKLPERERARKLLKEGLPDDLIYCDASQNTVGVMDGIKSKQYGEPTNVDIYTLVGAPDISKMTDAEIKKILRRNKICTKLFLAKYGDYHKLRKRYKVLPYLTVKALLHLVPNGLIRRLITHYEYKYNYDGAPYMMALMTYRRTTEIMPSEIYNGTLRHQFEDLEVNIPVGYHTFLCRAYGEDYMTPKQTGWK